jgi:hypothetical protein
MLGGEGGEHSGKPPFCMAKRVQPTNTASMTTLWSHGHVEISLRSLLNIDVIFLFCLWIVKLFI